MKNIFSAKSCHDTLACTRTADWNYTPLPFFESFTTNEGKGGDGFGEFWTGRPTSWASFTFTGIERGFTCTNLFFYIMNSQLENCNSCWWPLQINIFIYTENFNENFQYLFISEIHRNTINRNDINVIYCDRKNIRFIIQDKLDNWDGLYLKFDKRKKIKDKKNCKEENWIIW